MRTNVITGAASRSRLATAHLLTDQGNTVLGVDPHDADTTIDLGPPAGRQALVDEVTRRTGGRIDVVSAQRGRVAIQRKSHHTGGSHAGTVR